MTAGAAPAPPELLAGRVAIVTGAGLGLGRAYARGLADAGAAVVVNDRNQDRADEVAAEIVAAGGRAVAAAGAVGPSDRAEALVDAAVDAFDRLDILCANAGVLRDRTLDKMTDDEFDAVIDSHLRGTVTCARAAVRRLRTQGQGGRLVLVGSPAGQRASFGQTAYTAAKAAIGGLVRTWALELARFEVTVNAVVPLAATRLVASVPALTETVAAVERGEPVPRRLRQRGLGVPEDVVPLVVHLASSAAGGVTGQCFGVGGDRISLWSHPREVVEVVRDGGWDASTVQDAFDDVLSHHLQPYTNLRPPW